MEILQNILDFISNLFHTNNLLSRHFQENIWQYNSVLTFISLKCIPDLRFPTRGIQNFQIYRELYYIQRQINTELYNNDPTHYV